MTRDPDWWTPHTDDYAATYDGTGDPDDLCLCGLDECVECGGAGGVGDELADTDTTIRYTVERGRPGYADQSDDDD